jgi:hypothetical protein
MDPLLSRSPWSFFFFVWCFFLREIEVVLVSNAKDRRSLSTRFFSIKLNYVAHLRHLARAGVVAERKPKQVWEKIKPAIQLSLSRPALDIYILFPQLPFWFWHLEMNGRHFLSVCLCVYSLKGRIRAQNWLQRNIWRSISADDTDTKIKGFGRGIWLKFEFYIRRGFWWIEIFGGLFCIIWSRSDGCHSPLNKARDCCTHNMLYRVVGSWWKYFI